MRNKKSLFEKVWFWLLIPVAFLGIFLLFYISISYKTSRSTELTIDPAAEETTTEETPETLPEEDKPIEAQLKYIIDSLNIKYSDLSIYRDDPDYPQYIIRYLSDETFWNEKDFVIDCISNYVNLCDEAYTKDIDKIELIVYVKMTDARGNENEDLAFNMCMTKDNYNKYDWNNLKMSTINYDLLKSDCEELYIHPGISKNVDFNDLYYR